MTKNRSKSRGQPIDWQTFPGLSNARFPD